MRIIGGSFRGLTLRPPLRMRTRPTTDFAREGLMNILAHRYDWGSLRVLDLFSGTGAFSYECYSRGVRHIDLVEKNNIMCHFIRSQIRRFKAEESMCLYAMDVGLFLSKLPMLDTSQNASFDIIFADPPFSYSHYEPLYQAVMHTSALLNVGGVFILEHPSHLMVNEWAGFQEQRAYGGVQFSFFQQCV